MPSKVEIKHLDPKYLNQKGAVKAYLESVVFILNLIGELPVTRLEIDHFGMKGDSYEIKATVNTS